MNASHCFFILMVVSLWSFTSESTGSRITIVEPTVQQEASSIWRTIHDISFLEEQGYTIHLPKGAFIDSLINKSKNGTFGNEDFSAIYHFVETQVFDKKNYQTAIQKIEDQMDLLHTLLAELDQKKALWDWTFNMFDSYQVILTLFGTGGSYDPDAGTITLQTNAEGRFKNYDNPTNTIIHEIAHMGMEYSLVRKYQLNHGLKERLVDTFVHLLFQDELPEYTVQNMGDTRLDLYLKSEMDIKELPAILSELLPK